MFGNSTSLEELGGGLRSAGSVCEYSSKATCWAQLVHYCYPAQLASVQKGRDCGNPSCLIQWVLKCDAAGQTGKIQFTFSAWGLEGVGGGLEPYMEAQRRVLFLLPLSLALQLSRPSPLSTHTPPLPFISPSQPVSQFPGVILNQSLELE